LAVWPSRTSKYLSMLIKETFLSWLFDALVRGRLTNNGPYALTPLPMRNKPPSNPQLQQVQNVRAHWELCRARELRANKREIHLIEVKLCFSQTWSLWKTPGLDTSRDLFQTAKSTLCKCLKAKNAILCAIFLGRSLNIPQSTLHHFEELGLYSKKIHKTARKLHVHSLKHVHLLIKNRHTLA